MASIFFGDGFVFWNGSTEPQLELLEILETFTDPGSSLPESMQAKVNAKIRELRVGKSADT